MTSGSIPHGACSRTTGHALLSYPAAHGAGAHFLGLSGHSAEHPAIWVSSSCLLKNSVCPVLHGWYSWKLKGRAGFGG